MSDDRKIRLGGGYWLYSDKYCCWIMQECVTQKGKNIGKTYTKRVSGYFAKVEDALESLVDRHSREISANSINTLIKEIKSLKSLIKEIGENLNERSGSTDRTK